MPGGPVERPPDPMTDSAVRRLTMGMGTQVRLHLYRATVDVDLLAIADVSTWSDLEYRVMNGIAISVDRPRMCFAGGVVLWIEDITPLADQ